MKFYNAKTGRFTKPSSGQILQAIKPIETMAFDHRFRSRLEARWATFFEYLDLRWEYEKEGYDVNGVWYLPDFYLPTVGLRNSKKTGVWVEIKPLEYECGAEDTDKYMGLYELTRRPLILFKGIPECDEDRGSQFGDPYDEDGWWDNWMVFCKCHICGYVKIEFSESNYFDCPVCGRENPPKLSPCDPYHPDIFMAVTAAKQARFE